LKSGGNTETEEPANPRPAPEQYSEREKWLEQLSTSQIPALLEALCANIGPEADLPTKTRV